MASDEASWMVAMSDSEVHLPYFGAGNSFQQRWVIRFRYLTEIGMKLRTTALTLDANQPQKVSLCRERKHRGEHQGRQKWGNATTHVIDLSQCEVICGPEVHQRPEDSLARKIVR
jgi:hypothetical protein